jgi:hypothetical protein
VARRYDRLPDTMTVVYEVAPKWTPFELHSKKSAS